MRSGSATISRTVIRGLSDAYGSWKTIWMSRRTGRICLRLNFVMSAPLKMIWPLVGSTSLMIVRPSVVFPQPDSPTTPSVSPRVTVRSTPSTARTWPTVCLRTPALIGKCLTRPSIRRISFGSAAVGRRRRRRRARRLAHRRSSRGRAEMRRPGASSSAKWQAEMWSSPSPELPQLRDLRPAARPALRVDAARMERAAGRQA